MRVYLYELRSGCVYWNIIVIGSESIKWLDYERKSCASCLH